MGDTNVGLKVAHSELLVPVRSSSEEACINARYGHYRALDRSRRSRAEAHHGKGRAGATSTEVKELVNGDLTVCESPN